MKSLMKLYNKNTKISITIRGDGSEIFDYSLPQPHNYIRTSSERYTIEYYLFGDFFCTNKAGAYLNDILARFTLSMNVISATAKINKEAITHKPLKLYDNNQFNGLRSIQKFKYKETVDVDKDNVFWAIKLYTEDLIKKSSGMVAYSLLESFAFAHFVDRAKDRSTLKAKCRSIWNWYDERDWTIPTRKGLGMSRQEGAEKARELLQIKTKQKVTNAIQLLVFKNKKVNANSISKESGVSRVTAKKYLIELGYKK